MRELIFLPLAAHNVREWLLEKYGEMAIEMLGKALVTVLIFVVGKLVIGIFKSIIKKTITKNPKLPARKAKTVGTVLTSVVKYVSYFVLLCVVLNYWGVDAGSLLTLGGVATVAVGLGAQSIISDIMTGAFILMEDQFGVGDIITTEGYTGVVVAIGLRTTVLRSADGNMHIIPNGQIKIVTNMSKEFNRGIVDVSVAYEEDLDRVMKVLEDEMTEIYDKEHIEGLLSKPVIWGVEELGDSGIKIRIAADCKVGQNWNVERAIRYRVKNRFDKEGIEIPFPQVVVSRKGEK
ncbi:MAG: mechanosensitive ion channel family protein [Firmicutes bacterium]|nr:mechanosensitive ion channel family protein [Bacillota bacterium]